MDELWKAIAGSIERADPDALAPILEQLDERQRRQVAKRLKTLGEPDVEAVKGALIELAVLATATPSKAMRHWRGHVHPSYFALYERQLRARPREWRQELAERISARPHASSHDWDIVLRMVNDGLIDRPAHVGYVTRAPWALAMRTDGEGHYIALVDALRSEPEWLRDELWQIFAVEGTEMIRQDLREPRWQQALCTLSAEGTISRDRLLDESLAALRRDFSPRNARWYQGLWEALAPTLDEQLARLDDLLALLAAPDSAVVGFSLRTLAALDRAVPLPPVELVESLAPAFVNPRKGHAMEALKLAERAMARDGSAVSPVIAPLIDALTHEARDVQAAALRLLEAHRSAIGEPDRQRIAERAARVDPKLRALAAELGGDVAPDTAQPPPAEPVALPPRRALSWDSPRLDDAGRLQPIGDLADLLARASVAFERGDDPDEIELVLDAVSRLRAEPVDPGRARALMRRLDTITLGTPEFVPFVGAGLALGLVLRAWLSARSDPPLTFGSRQAALTDRLEELAADLKAGPPRQLLATPTHRGGWIDPRAAVERLAGQPGGEVLPHDFADMILRLAPDGRAVARAEAERLPGETGAVLRFALGAGVATAPGDGRLAGAWRAAADARDPGACSPPLLPADAPSSLPEDIRRPGIPRWLTRVFPCNRDAVYRMVSQQLWAAGDSRVRDTAEVIEILLEPREPIGSHAVMMLALAVGSQEPDARLLAVDVLVVALQDRRLDGRAIGEALLNLLEVHPAVVPARWTGALGAIAASGPLGAIEAQRAIETILAGADAADTKRLLGLVEPLRNLAVADDAAVEHPRTRAWLERLPPKSAAGRNAREALEVTGRGVARSHLAVAQVAS